MLIPIINFIIYHPAHLTQEINHTNLDLGASGLTSAINSNFIGRQSEALQGYINRIFLLL